MNFFKRFTSVFFCCVFLSSFFVVPVFAVDDGDYYSLPPVVGSEPSLSVSYPVNPSATGDGWTSSDSSRLRDIWQALTDSSSGNSGSIAYCVWWIWNYLKDDIRSSLGNIDRNTSVTASRILDSNSLLGSINSSVSGIDGYATETTLKAFSDSFSSFAPLNSEWPSDPVSFGSYFNKVFSITTNPALVGDTSTDYNKGFIFNVWANPVDDSISSRFAAHFSWSGLLSTLLANFIYDGINNSYAGGGPTIYRMLHLLQSTLASEDDRQLADNYKENREQAEQDFLSGKSGKTSLGKEDFGSLSGVGGTFKDITSLNGQASIGSFTDGLSSANETGQGWFSQATKDALDSVSDSSSNVSTFSVEGDYMEDTDIYNMSGFEDHYSWLWGD